MSSKIKCLAAAWALAISFGPLVAFASTGTIDTSLKYAWGDTVGWVNLNPANGNVAVSDTALTGYIWSQNYGWINLAPSNGGVKNNGTGTLSGYAWGDSIGWVNFTGVAINPATGVFSGTATTASAGSITFSCGTCGVTTSWRPTPPSGGGGSFSPAPIISDISATTGEGNAVSISWITNVSADSTVKYGTSTDYSQHAYQGALVTAHKLVLPDVTLGSVYHFVVESAAASSGTSTSSDQTFTVGSVAISPSSPPPPSTSSSGTPPSSESGGAGEENLNYRVVAKNGTVYVIMNNQRYGVTSPGILYSYGFGFDVIKPATEADMGVPAASALLLPGNGSLVKSQRDNTVYLISEGRRHGFTSAAVFVGAGFKWSSILTVTDPELQALPEGALISSASAAHLPGVDIIEGGTIYWVASSGSKQGYTSVSVYNSWHRAGDFSTVVRANQADQSLVVSGFVQPRVIK